MKERERDMVKIVVHLAESHDSGMQTWQFDCSRTTNIEQLKSMAIEVTIGS